MNIVSVLQHTSRWLNTVVEKLLLIMGSAICIILFAQVVSRYMGHSLGWSEEVSRHLLIAITFLGGSSAYKRSSFIGLQGIGQYLGKRAQRMIVLMLQGVPLGCFGILAWFGTGYTVRAWELSTASLQIPMSIPFAAIPISALVFMVHVLADIAETLGEAAP